MTSSLESCEIPLKILAYVGYRTLVFLATSDSVIDTRDDNGRNELWQVSKEVSFRLSPTGEWKLTIKMFQLNVVASKFLGDCGKKFITKHRVKKHTPMMLIGNPHFPRLQGRGSRDSPTRRFRMMQLIETM